MTRTLLALLCLSACGTAGSGDDPDCLPSDTSGVDVDGAATLGLDAGGFAAIESGAALELELGTQGGWMVRPQVQFDAAALGAGDGACVWVESTATVDGSPDPISMFEVPEFAYEGGTGLSRPLLVLLSFDLEAVEGRDATIEVRVEGPEAGSTAAIDVSLVNER